MQFDDIAPKCEYIHAHPDLIHKAETLMPDEDDLYDLAELFKIFGDSTRVRFCMFFWNVKCASAILHSF